MTFKEFATQAHEDQSFHDRIFFGDLAAFSECPLGCPHVRLVFRNDTSREQWAWIVFADHKFHGHPQSTRCYWSGQKPKPAAEVAVKVWLGGP